MVKCLWCLKELGILGMLFHKAVCLEYLYSKSLDKLKQAKQTQLITKEQYLNEKRNLREYFMSRFKPKVYEAFIKRQKEQQYIVINPNELSVALESDIDMISKKVCFESLENSQQSQFLESFQNIIEPDNNNYTANNYSDYLDVQHINITKQLVNGYKNNNNNQIDNNQQDELNRHQLEKLNLRNINQQIDQYDNSQDQIVQLQQNIIQQQIGDNLKEKTQQQKNEEQKENILFKLLQKRAKPNSQKEFNKTIFKNQNIRQKHTRSKSRKIKEDSKISDSKVETKKALLQQEELATEIKSIGINDFKTNKKNPPKFSQSSDKINTKVNKQIELPSKKELNIQQKTKIQKKTKSEVFSNTKQNNSLEKPIQKDMIKTRFQASLDNLQNQAKAKSLQTRDKQKIKKK